MIVTKEQQLGEKQKLDLREVTLSAAEIQNNGMQIPLTQDSDWRINHLKRKTTKIGALCGVTICILLCVVVALAVLLSESRQVEPISHANADSLSMPNARLEEMEVDQAVDNIAALKEAIAHETAIAPNATSNDTIPAVITIQIIHEEIVGFNHDFSDISEDYDNPELLEESNETNTFPTSPIEEPGVPLEEEDLRMVTLDEWGGMEPLATESQTHPTPYVVICQTDGPACYDKTTCSEEMRNIQAFQIETQLLPNLGDNFYIGGDGRVYIGRGWDVTNYHVGFIRHKNIGICFIGDFDFDMPTNAQLRAAQELLSYGVDNLKLDPNYKLLAHNQILLPDSRFMGPGLNLLRHIDTWPHRCFNSCDVNASTNYQYSYANEDTNQPSYAEQILLRFLGLS